MLAFIQQTPILILNGVLATRTENVTYAQASL